MESNLKIVPPELLMEPLLKLLDETAAVPLVVSGSSMTPFLVPRRDTVYLSKVDRPLKRGDVVLYRRTGGRYVLHRILREEKDTFTMLGDAQQSPEPGIRPEQVLAVVTAVHRKGKLLQKGSFLWGFFEIVWIRMVPLRPAAQNLYSSVKRLFGGKGAI